MTTRKFYKTILTIEVLSEDAPVGEIDLDTLHYETTEGGWSCILNVTDQTEITPKEAAKELNRHHSDSEFFGLDEEGNDLDFPE